MFKNSGGKLKGLAKFIFVFLIIVFSLTALGMIAFGILYMRNSAGKGVVIILTGLVCAVLGIITAWLSSIYIYAFGQQVEDTQKIREILEYKVLGQKAPNPETVDYFANKAVNSSPAAYDAPLVPPVPPIYKKENASRPARAAVKNDDLSDDLIESTEGKFYDGWKCPACGSRNSKLVSVCMNCGGKKDASGMKDIPVQKQEAPEEKAENIEKETQFLPISCPNCGTVSKPGEKFCMNCGTKLIR